MPNLEFEKCVKINLNSSVNLNIKNLKIYPDFLSIYNYKNFNINKILIRNSDIKLKLSDLNLFVKIISNQNSKISIKKNLFINVINKK